MGERLLRKTYTKKAIHEMSAAQFQAVKKEAKKVETNKRQKDVRSSSRVRECPGVPSKCCLEHAFFTHVRDRLDAL
jgi:hypothetical protein